MVWTPELGVIRTIRPTDLVALVAFEARAYPNCVRTRDQLAQARVRLLARGALFEQWISLEDRHTLVAVEGHSIRGLISARHRAGRTAWEVDWLILGQEEGAELISQALLEYQSEMAIAAGVRRIFLRLPQESPLVTAARKAGFWPYVSEALYQRDRKGEVPPLVPPIDLRPRLKGDDLNIFRLYHSAVPQPVRSVEGMTLQEWCETQDARFGRQREFVCVQQDQLYAWLRVTQGAGCGQFQLLLNPSEEAALRELVHFALSRLNKPQTVLALVPDFQSSLQSALTQEWEFEELAQYYSLVRQLTVPAKEGRLALAGA